MLRFEKILGRCRPAGRYGKAAKLYLRLGPGRIGSSALVLWLTVVPETGNPEHRQGDGEHGRKGEGGNGDQRNLSAKEIWRNVEVWKTATPPVKCPGKTSSSANQE